MNIAIERLKDNPQYLNNVVEWVFSEWGKNNYNYWYSWIKNSMTDSFLPQTYIILVDGNLAGTYSIWLCDLQSRQDLSPWFGGMYVDIGYRGRKYNGRKLGEYMQQDAINRAKEAGIESLYLFTQKNVDYYIKNGWNYIGDAIDEADEIVLLCEYNVKKLL